MPTGADKKKDPAKAFSLARVPETQQTQKSFRQ